jgi:hypothetical protein
MKGVESITVPSHHQMPRQPGMLTERAFDSFVNLKRNDTVSNSPFSHPRAISSLFYLIVLLSHYHLKSYHLRYFFHSRSNNLKLVLQYMIEVQ